MRFAVTRILTAVLAIGAVQALFAQGAALQDLGTGNVATLFARDPLMAVQPATRRNEIVRQCEQLFGRRITPPRKPGQPDVEVFEIDKLYAMAATFAASGELTQLEIGWKSRLPVDHPEWDDPETPHDAFLSTSRFQELIEQLDRVHPKGKLVKHDDIFFVTNSTARRKDEHEHATLEWGEVMDLRRPANAPTLVWWVRVTNLR